MPLVNLSIQHGRTLDEARERLQLTVREIQTKFSTVLQNVQWAADFRSVTMSGAGLHVEMRVDEQNVHVALDMPLLSGLLRAPFLAGVKGILQKTFQKRLV